MLRGFDPVWYRQRYPDLAGMRTLAEVRHHYLAHGRREGRLANARAEEEADFRRYLTRSADFDLTAYRLLNPDLARACREDRDYVLHFIRHGRAEGRPAVFAADDSGDGSGDGSGERGRAGLAEPWMQLFSTAHYSAWIGEDAGAPSFAGRGEAIAHFRAHGMAALAPIHFDHLFDPAFYRAHHARSEPDDARLYREWLEQGLGEGRAANESQALLPLVGHAGFPEGFDWRGYAALRRLPAGSRVRVLAALFETERDWAAVRPLIAAPRAPLAAHLARYRLQRGAAGEAEAIVAGLAAGEADWPAALHALNAELLARRGQTAAALAACEHALRGGDDSWATFERAVTLATTLATGLATDGTGRRDALALLQRHAARWTGRADWAALVGITIDRLFAQAHEQALADLRDRPADEAGAAFTAALADLAEAMATLGTPPAPLAARLPAAADGPVVMLGDETLRQCTHYRLEQKAEQFAAAGIALRRHGADDVAGFLDSLPGARAAIFYRVQATPAIMRAILCARAMGLPTYYEIDDLLFDPAAYPPPLATYGGNIGAAEWEALRQSVWLFRFALSLCDRAIASTASLLAAMAPLTREGTGLVVRNGLDSRNRAAIALGARPPAETGRIRIFYGSGTLAHAEDFSTLAAPALARIMAERAEVDLVLVGHVPHDAGLDRLGARVLRYPFIDNIADYWSVLAACDVALAMLAPGAAADAKSEIKWLEAAAAGIPTVASDTATFREVIVPGETGLLAADADGWYRALAMLCGDAALRRRIGQAARAQALRDYSLEAAAEQWRAVFPALIPTTSAPAISGRRPRVLVVNVFFAPQSIGGATRVVEDNVRHLAETGEFELAVFCTDEGFGPPGRLATSPFGDVPVFRLALGPRDDVLADDPAALPAFRRVLDLFAPDLVHFHCVQRLSAAPLRECLDRCLPYVVTVHDGWWISLDQFLVDRDGILRLPGPDLFAGFAARPGATDAALRRRQALAPLLLGASRLLTVSEPFAEICRAAGLPGIVALPNGLPDLPAPMPAPATGEAPLRLAHIGGRASHKGADLVEAALRRGHYPNLSLLMVDGRLAAGEALRTRWGASEVMLSAPWPQARVCDLYGQVDVLLAPSRWPESFGLVTREAQHFGCWVVASSLGAIGDEVVPGRTGFVVDPFAPGALAQVLRRLDADPGAYRRGTIAPGPQPLRHARDQARELSRIYFDILGSWL